MYSPLRVPLVAIFTVPAHALYFSGYEASKRALGSDASWAHFVSGFVADVCGAALWCPQDVVKQKLQVQEHARGAKDTPRYRNAVHALVTVAREEGIRGGLYRGFNAAILVYGPMVALHFTLYEALTRRAALMLAKRDNAVAPPLNAVPPPLDAVPVVSASERDALPRVVFLGAALVSASTAALVTTPLDVVKTRLQVTSAREGGYRGIGHALSSIWRSEGAPAFFRGSSARTLWLGPNAALCMLFYETFKQLVARAVHLDTEQ